MILLDKSSCDLLRYLIQLETPETIMTISRSTEQSRRKIYYHLDKINDALPDDVSPIVSKPRVGILLNHQQKEACQTLLAEVASDSYIMSIDERIQLMIVYIAISSERVTIEKLMDLTDVSRNTVLNDLNDIRYRLAQEQYKVNLYATKSQGYFLQCHPLNKIQYVHSFLYDLFNEASPGFLNILREKLMVTLADEGLLSDQAQDFLLAEVSKRENDLGKKINRSEISLMLRILPYLLLSYQTMELSLEEVEDMQQKFAPVHQRIEYQVAQKISQSIQGQLAVELDEIGTCLIAILLLSYRKERDSHLTSQDFQDMAMIIDWFMASFEQTAQVRLVQKEELARRLLTHTKALLFRKNYGILSKNPLTKHIKQKYHSLFVEVKKAALILEEEWQISLNDDDLAYLTIHFGGYLEKEMDTLESSHLQQVYIICDEGVSIQKLLLRQCQKYLPPNSIQATFTTEQFKSVEDLLVADLLISTSDALETQFPLVQVQPILSYDDVVKLSHFLRHYELMTCRPHFEKRLEQLLGPHVTSPGIITQLSQEICSLFDEELLHLSHQGVTSEHTPV
ncbi:BglG family transcription antiterminator [Streptococcus cuniculipharyngis]|uniref:Transcription antiterminator n=1 Tax=Streptococcus cuniculipharyngis TaxID=1562651 RepID=A0A5C5SCX9_9STRE|nr:transcription antiterminator [Streptococcus cuniculipharyngis]TWS97447.1 transcription antiterminator [Streptococcus cuniculipharyngis]